MKKIAIGLVLLGALLLVLVITVSYGVWRATATPIARTPSALETGRQQLHLQLEQSRKREAEIEKQDWNSVTLLHELVSAHQERIEKLKDNKQADEILAYDRDSVTRLEKRIEELGIQQAAAAEQAAAPSTPAPQN